MTDNFLPGTTQEQSFLLESDSQRNANRQGTFREIIVTPRQGGGKIVSRQEIFTVFRGPRRTEQGVFSPIVEEFDADGNLIRRTTSVLTPRIKGSRPELLNVERFNPSGETIESRTVEKTIKDLRKTSRVREAKRSRLSQERNFKPETLRSIDIGGSQFETKQVAPNKFDVSFEGRTFRTANPNFVPESVFKAEKDFAISQGNFSNIDGSISNVQTRFTNEIPQEVLDKGNFLSTKGEVLSVSTSIIEPPKSSTKQIKEAFFSGDTRLEGFGLGVQKTTQVVVKKAVDRVSTKQGLIRTGVGVGIGLGGAALAATAPVTGAVVGVTAIGATVVGTGLAIKGGADPVDIITDTGLDFATAGFGFKAGGKALTSFASKSPKLNKLFEFGKGVEAKGVARVKTSVVKITDKLPITKEFTITKAKGGKLTDIITSTGRQKLLELDVLQSTRRSKKAPKPRKNIPVDFSKVVVRQKGTQLGDLNVFQLNKVTAKGGKGQVSIPTTAKGVKQFDVILGSKGKSAEAVSNKQFILDSPSKPPKLNIDTPRTPRNIFKTINVKPTTITKTTKSSKRLFNILEKDKSLFSDLTKNIKKVKLENLKFELKNLKSNKKNVRDRISERLLKDHLTLEIKKATQNQNLLETNKKIKFNILDLGRKSFTNTKTIKRKGHKRTIKTRTTPKDLLFTKEFVKPIGSKNDFIVRETLFTFKTRPRSKSPSKTNQQKPTKSKQIIDLNAFADDIKAINIEKGLSTSRLNVATKSGNVKRIAIEKVKLSELNDRLTGRKAQQTANVRRSFPEILEGVKQQSVLKSKPSSKSINPIIGVTRNTPKINAIFGKVATAKPKGGFFSIGGSKSKAKSKSNIFGVGKSKNTFKSLFDTKTNTKSKDIFTPIDVTGSKHRTTFNSALGLTTSTSSKFKDDFKPIDITRLVPDGKVPPPPPIFRLPRLGGGVLFGRGERPTKGKKRKSAKNPSLFGVFSGKKGKIPDILTGIEVRAIPIR